MENKVKKPMNAYMLFSKEKRSEIITQNPELKTKIAEVSKLIASQWKAMTDEQKAKYRNLAVDDKQRYENETKTKIFKLVWNKFNMSLFVLSIKKIHKFCFRISMEFFNS